MRVNLIEACEKLIPRYRLQKAIIEVIKRNDLVDYIVVEGQETRVMVEHYALSFTWESILLVNTVNGDCDLLSSDRVSDRICKSVFKMFKYCGNTCGNCGLALNRSGFARFVQCEVNRRYKELGVSCLFEEKAFIKYLKGGE